MITCYYPTPPGIRRQPQPSKPRRLEGGRAPGTLSPPAPWGVRGLPRGEHNLPRGFVEFNQRERIFDAIARLTARNGYQELNLDDIAAAAAISLQTFYSHFENKEEAFLATFEVGHARAKAAVNRALAHQIGGEPVRTVDGVSMTVEPGEMVALYGPSSSGKTTLLLMVATLLAPTSGAVLIGGRDVSSLSEREASHFRLSDLGFIRQNFDLLPGVTAIDNAVLKPLKSMRWRDAHRKIAPLLERLGLGGRLEHRAETLSMGERQRVMIARALHQTALAARRRADRLPPGVRAARRQARRVRARPVGRAGLRAVDRAAAVSSANVLLDPRDGKGCSQP